MPQTLLAILGLGLTSLVAFNQQRASTQSYEAMIKNEFELAATGALMHVMEFIGARSFDERATPGGVRSANALPVGANDFVAISGFGAQDRGSLGCDLLAPRNTPDCDDIDDTHGINWQPITARLSDGRTLPFEVSVRVDYVTDDSLRVPSTTPTTHKRVVLTARTPYLPQYPQIAQVERVFSYDPNYTESSYESVYGPILE
ncbi:MAG TPA: hypothetical protein VD962_07330 [Rubricoccaceae bacterium]|nr:hypothetical protein [Rubricoccaceae bacterium]